ncbi:MAG: hypothetical protein AABY22_25865, partial [Nanoarchaeota archaeon]
MSKKNNTLKIFLISLLVLIIIGAIGASIYFFAKQTGFGGTIISLQQVDFISSDPTIGGKAWLLTMVQDGASQFARGVFTTDVIN